MASRTASAPCPASAGPFFARGPHPWPAMGGRWSSIVNRVVRSTRVPIAEPPEPRMRSPSQWPGTARSAASAGRSLIKISGPTKPLLRPRVRARGTRSAPGPQARGQLATQRAAALDVERLIDRLVRDAHRVIIREVQRQSVGDLRRAPRVGPAAVFAASVTAPDPAHIRTRYGPAVGRRDFAGEPLLHVLTQPRVGGQLGRLRPPRPPLGMPLRGRGPILQPAAAGRGVAAQLARDRRRSPPDTPRDLPHPAPAGLQQRDLLALGE